MRVLFEGGSYLRKYGISNLVFRLSNGFDIRGENQTTVPHLGGARFDDHNGVIIIKAMPQASDLKMTSYLQTYHPIC